MNPQRVRSNQPLYMRILDSVKSRIQAGEWNPGSMLPSENELGEFYNISRGTVRQVLAALEQEGLIQRERGRGTFISYGANTVATAPANNRIVSFIVPYVRDSFVASILLGLESEARANGYSVLFNHIENDIDKQDQVIRTALQQRVAGIVLYPINSTEISSMVTSLIEQNFPLVLVDRYTRGLNLSYVTSNNFGGGLIATQHLLSLGHKRIAFLKWVEISSAMEHRRAGYRQALAEAGIPNDPSLEWEVVGYPLIDQEAIEKQLSQPNPPTAIFAANDQLALGVMRAARSLGKSIPQDVALVGFDDLDISAHLDIPLTTVAQPTYEIGQTAWNVLYNKITRKQAGIERLILPVRLVVRQSCGAALAGDEK